MLRFFAGLAILILSLFAQLLAGSAGVHVNFTLATLIALAMTFGFWELFFCDLLAVFVLNWEPAASPALIAFALIPLAAYAFRKVFALEPWMAGLIAIVAGFSAFYLVAAPAAFAAGRPDLLLDVGAGILAGEVIIFALS
ncbi:MAG TPA: hypothetical protein VMT81_02995 [Candidatus Paceibacterota bacterium]|nr:hypothetical protein [Candidatus Paceibacterota bacterium]